MELEFDKYCVVDGSPTTVLPAPRHCPKVEKRRSKRKQKCGNETVCLNEDFTENNFHHYRSVSCKDSVSRTSSLEGSEVVRRGSAYCSSKELRHLQKTDAGEERRKIEFSSGCITASSFGIVDALCSSDEDSSQAEEKTSSVMLMDNSDLSSGACKILGAHYSFKSPIHPIPEIGASPGNRPRETDHSAVFPKSLSTKFRVPHSPARSESDCSRASSSKSRFTPMRKMFDPFRKSKSQRSPLSNPVECRLASLNPKFSNTTLQFTSRKESHNSLASFVPTHLHGFLKLDRKHGVPFFEFSANFPEDVFLAKTWKVGNALNWVYTFYSLGNTRKSNGSGCGGGTKKESLLVGQMQVSSTQVKNGNGGASMVMEFVLYDTAHPRRSVSFWDTDSSSPSSDVPKGSTKNLVGGNNEESDEEFVQGKAKSNNQSKNAAAELHGQQQQLEIAAIVIEVAVEKRESLEFKSDHTLSNHFFEEGTHGNPCSTSKVVTVIPSGNHSLPTTETRGPSPLLDRWRSGGGCDCGGWDMACPLNVFINNLTAARCPLIHNQRSLQLFIQVIVVV